VFKVGRRGSPVIVQNERKRAGRQTPDYPHGECRAVLQLKLKRRGGKQCLNLLLRRWAGLRAEQRVLRAAFAVVRSTVVMFGVRAEKGDHRMSRLSSKSYSLGRIPPRNSTHAETKNPSGRRPPFKLWYTYK
jgi:hypothetical protein